MTPEQEDALVAKAISETLRGLEKDEDAIRLAIRAAYAQGREDAAKYQRDLATAREALSAKDSELASVKAALKLANDSCRSAYQVAARKGIETNWETLQFALQKSLKEQHKVMCPEQYTEDRRIHAHANPKENK